MSDAERMEYLRLDRLISVDSGTTRLLCPFCSDPAMHLIETLILGSGKYEEVRLIFECESEERQFAVEFSAGKGQCFVRAIEEQPVERESDEEERVAEIEAGLRVLVQGMAPMRATLAQLTATQAEMITAVGRLTAALREKGASK